jgi:hypothetical protein
VVHWFSRLGVGVVLTPPYKKFLVIKPQKKRQPRRKRRRRNMSNRTNNGNDEDEEDKTFVSIKLPSF